MSIDVFLDEAHALGDGGRRRVYNEFIAQALGQCEAVAQEAKPFNIGATLVEPGDALTEFRYGSAKVAKLTPVYDACHGFLNMLDSAIPFSREKRKRVAKVVRIMPVTGARTSTRGPRCGREAANGHASI